MWTDEELYRLIDAVELYPGDWIKASSLVGPSKTPDLCKIKAERLNIF